MGFNKVVLSDHIHLNEFQRRVGLHSYSHLRFNVSTSVMTCVVTTQEFFKSDSESQNPPQRRLPECPKGLPPSEHPKILLLSS